MKKTKMLLLIFFISFLSSCINQSTDSVESPWQEIYTALLHEYLYKDGMLFFALHDFDLNGIPELLIAGELNDEMVDVVYTVRNGYAFQLIFDEHVNIAGYAMVARGGISAPPNGIPGLITYLSGAGGLFGSNRFFNHIVIYENTLSINVRGSKMIDVDTLRIINDDFGGLLCYDMINEHTIWSLNDEEVPNDTFYHLFGHNERIDMMRIDEVNVHSMIYSTQN